LNTCRPINLSATAEDLLNRGLLLPVMEMFYSVQGEGFNTGKPAAFVRIGGCDVGCHWCDVKEAWDASLHSLTKTKEIIDYLSGFPAKSVVITGGEPLNYNLGPLCNGLKNRGVKIFIETCGAYPLSGSFDWICLSPKRNMRPRADMLQMADELKVIIHKTSDLEWAAQNADLIKESCLLYLQPEWSKYNEMLPQIVEYVQQHPRWMISLQAHKFMNIP